MAAKKADPTEPIRLKASQYPLVDQGTACTQSSFKTGKKAFLYIGEQGGRYKAMFKLDKSVGQALKLAKETPEDYQVGNGGWVTARFSTDKPLSKKLWQKWLDESYELSVAGAPQKKAVKKKAATKKKTTKKTVAKKKTAQKKAAKKKKATKKR